MRSQSDLSRSKIDSNAPTKRREQENNAEMSYILRQTLKPSIDRQKGCFSTVQDRPTIRRKGLADCKPLSAGTLKCSYA